MKFSCLAGSLALALILSTWPANALAQQDADSANRPRIGLVLGGGGARGAAHIGVLAELERRRIPVDAIAGTSMGAIVGSLYAAGISPAELETLVRSIDWADAFVDSPPRRDLSFRRKEDDQAYPANLEVGVRDGEILIPRGLIQGQKLQLILREALLHVSHIEDFDQLPTPFRAVASDIATGELHVMSKGDLALAARASMSAPGIFAPVEVDGRTLVDGGLVGNLPVDVIRQMDVDVIIAVDVEFPLYDASRLESALQITEQMLTILIRKETVRQVASLGADDVLIRPQLGLFGSTNFTAITEAIEPGRAAADAVGDQLDRLALSADDYGDFLASRRGPAVEPVTIDFVRIDDDSPLSPGVLEARLDTEPGDILDVRSLEEDVVRLYGLNYYEHVGYRIVDENGQTGVEFQTRRKSWGPNFLKLGLSLEDDFEGSTAFNVAARLTATGLNALGAEWRNDIQLGTNPLFESELYQPLSFDSRYFVAPRITLEQDNFSTFTGIDSLARYRVSEAGIGLDFGRSLGHWGELRAGMFRGTGNARVRIGDPALPNFDFDAGGILARLRVDTLDDALIPRSGMRADIDWRMSRTGLGAADQFDTVEVSLDKVWTWGDDERNTIQMGLEYGTTFDNVDLVQQYFTLGGFLRLSGLDRGGISGPHKGLGRLVYYRRTGDGGGSVFDMPFYVGGSLEAGNAWRNRSDMTVGDLIVNGSLFAGVDTYLGPLFVAAGFSEEGESSFYLFFGNPTP